MDIINIKTIKAPNAGDLSFFESGVDLPFEIKRVYYIYGVPSGVRRGGHAHKHLQQMLFCPYGKVNIILDDGEIQEEITLDNPSKGVVIGEGIFRYMDFIEANSVLCVVASDYYDETDYIRNYDEFITLAKNGYWK